MGVNFPDSPRNTRRVRPHCPVPDVSPCDLYLAASRTRTRHEAAAEQSNPSEATKWIFILRREALAMTLRPNFLSGVNRAAARYGFVWHEEYGSCSRPAGIQNDDTGFQEVSHWKPTEHPLRHGSEAPDRKPASRANIEHPENRVRLHAYATFLDGNSTAADLSTCTVVVAPALRQPPRRPEIELGRTSDAFLRQGAPPARSHGAARQDGRYPAQEVEQSSVGTATKRGTEYEK